MGSEMEKAIGAVNEAEGHECDENFADGSNSKWTPTLLAKFAKACAQTHARKREQECPTGEVRKGCELRLGEEAERGEKRDEEKSEHKFREFLPEELRLVSDGLGLAA